MGSVFAARLFAALIAGAILFQIALATGMPWGEIAWGGYYPSVLPTHMRFASVASAFLLLLLGLVVLIRAGLVKFALQPSTKKLIWVVVAYCALGVIANGFTPSVWERVIWLPVTLILLASSIVVAKGP